MCFHLYLASPLTLSEVRSMLPKGLAADLLDPGEQRALKQLHPDAQTVAATGPRRLLLRSRGPAAPGEPGRRDLAPAPLPRPGASEDCRPRCAGAPPPGCGRAIPARRVSGPAKLADFVVEHARNAGPTLYYLHFSHDGTLGVLPPGEPPAQRASEVRMNPEGWLQEERPVLVLP
jgi:hypothetical protein